MVQQVQLQKTGQIPLQERVRPSTGPPQTSFSDVLADTQASKEVRFSAHAAKRLEERGITLDGDDMARINSAIDSAEAKGGRESLLLMDDLAMVVSVTNRTVITAVSRDEMENAVFTHIDSAVVVADKAAQPQQTDETGLDPAWGGPRAAERLTWRINSEG